MQPRKNLFGSSPHTTPVRNAATGKRGIQGRQDIPDPAKTAPKMFIADVTTDATGLDKVVSTDCSIHFCGEHCQKGKNCHNLGPADLSRSAAQLGYCTFCVNIKRGLGTKECNAAIHAVRVKDSGTGAIRWMTLKSPTDPLPSSKLDHAGMIKAIEDAHRLQVSRIKKSEEYQIIQGEKRVMEEGSREIAEEARAARTSVEEPGTKAGRALSLIGIRTARLECEAEIVKKTKR